jgi:transposase-like protein
VNDDSRIRSHLFIKRPKRFANCVSTQLKGWRRRWQNQSLARDRHIEKELQNLRQLQALRRIEEMRYLESCIQELLRALGDT